MSQHAVLQAAIAAQLTPDQLRQVYECQTKIEALIAEYPDIGTIAIALIGARLSEE